MFGNQQSNYLDLIKQMLHQSMLDTTNYEVSHVTMTQYRIKINFEAVYNIL